MADPKLAFVIDALPVMGGAERLLAAALEVFPDAPVYTLIFDRPAFDGTIFARKEIHTSFVHRIPAGRRWYRNLLPLLPLAVEQFDLRGFDIVVSFHYAVAQGVVLRPDQLHISYVHTPMRYAWQEYQSFIKEAGGGPKGWVARLILHYFRLWDVAAARRVDHFAAVSQWAARCVWRAYWREAEVIYPPVEIDRFRPLEPRQDYYIVVSRLVRHKRLDVVVDAFSRLGYPLRVVGDGSERARLSKMAASNIEFLGWQPDERVAELLGRARAFIHANEEDFGIALVEAQAAGCPVIAYATGGACETVIEGETGLFFAEQSADSLAEAVSRFERENLRFDVATLHRNAARFGKIRFQQEFAAMIEWEWRKFRG